MTGDRIHIVERSTDCLDAYADVPIAFVVTSQVSATAGDGQRGYHLHEEPVANPYTKDYDTIPEAHPTAWRGFDLSHWGFFDAVVDNARAGSIAIAWHPAGEQPLEGKADEAVVWDIRVAPEVRGAGVGSALLQHAQQWARERGCRSLMIETQSNNVPACRFYERNGYRLGHVDPQAYADLPAEAQMLWYKDLTTPDP